MRRDCKIPEHRKQIKSLQRFCEFLQAKQGEQWARFRVQQLELEKLQAENRQLRKVLSANGLQAL